MTLLIPKPFTLHDLTVSTWIIPFGNLVQGEDDSCMSGVVEIVQEKNDIVGLGQWISVLTRSFTA